jgi:hypothetical protein
MASPTFPADQRFPAAKGLVLLVVASAVGILSGMTSCAEPRLGAPGVYAA